MWQPLQLWSRTSLRPASIASSFADSRRTLSSGMIPARIGWCSFPTVWTIFSPSRTARSCRNGKGWSPKRSSAFPRERAFTVFTKGFNTWWPREHHIGAADLDEAVIEPAVGGRYYERGVDGSECDWGQVLAFEPFGRLVLSWHLQGDWKYDPDPAKASEIEVLFIAEAPDRTRVELEHRLIERHDLAEKVAEGVGQDGGWGGLLHLYAEAAAA